MFYHQLPLSKKNKKRYKEELEERLVSLVASLFGKEANNWEQSICEDTSILLFLGVGGKKKKSCLIFVCDCIFI